MYLQWDQLFMTGGDDYHIFVSMVLSSENFTAFVQSVTTITSNLRKKLL